MIPKSDWQKIKEMYLSGTGYKTIGKTTGYPRRQIRKCLVDQGVQIRVQTKDKYALDETAFDLIDNELAAYWLGFIYAEGCVYDTALRIDLHQRDIEHLEKIKPFLGTKRPLLKTTREGTPKVLFTARSENLSTQLRQLGILPERPNIKLCVSQISQELNKHFIRGYMDGDGSIRKRQPGIRFIGQTDLLQWIIDACAKEIGTNPNISLYEYKHTNKVKSMEFFRRQDVKRMLEYLYGNATVWLERKREKTKLWK